MKTWTDEELDILFETHPEDLEPPTSQEFAAIAKRLGRSPASVRAQWLRTAGYASRQVRRWWHAKRGGHHVRPIGSLAVDSGNLILGDPCYVLPWPESDMPGTSYEAVITDDGPDTEGDGRLAGATYLNGSPVILLPTHGDWVFPVYADLAGGIVQRVIIDLNPVSDDVIDRWYDSVAIRHGEGAWERAAGSASGPLEALDRARSAPS